MMQVIGYQIETTDGQVGKVEDFAISAERPQVECLVVHAGNWLDGRMVKLPAEEVKEIDWTDRVLRVRGTRAEIQHLPEYRPA
jgi:hypothetical protein